MGFEPSTAIDRYDLLPFAREIVRFAVRRGRAALFEDCGLTKTIQLLSWAAEVCKHTGGRVVGHCPIGVRHQFVDEATRRGIDVPVQIVNDQSEVADGINLINYEKLHKIDPSHFAGVFLDEASILKGHMGKIKQRLVESYRDTLYKLEGTATPAPNDYMELGSHCEFLGVMPSNEMLSRWFINDTMKAGGYRLKKHAQVDFWNWMTSWAICISKPSDIGFSDDGFDLPPLHEYEHMVEPEIETPPGMLFYVPQKINATTMHSEKKLTTDSRAAKVAEIVNGDFDPWVIWCDADYEADQLIKAIPEAIEVRGSDKDTEKERKLKSFSNGESRIIITKPTIAGFGLNWQHCNKAVFIGISYSYEQKYQAIRRNWRFGQCKPVHVHVVTTPAEIDMAKAQQRKLDQHESMKTGMAEAMKTAMRGQLRGELSRDQYSPTVKMELPSWMQSKRNLQSA